jgi:hypothetical protein
MNCQVAGCNRLSSIWAIAQLGSVNVLESFTPFLAGERVDPIVALR